MARYFFDIRQHEHAIADPEGEELASLDEARERAIEAAREIMDVMASQGIDAHEGEIAILDETKRILLVVHFHDASVSR